MLYYKSFLPSCIREWNEIPLNIRNSTSLSSFSGNILLQIHHTRLRTKCSSLNQHLHSKNIIDNPLCACGSVETTNHFLLERPQNIQARRDMITTLPTFCVPSLNNLLYGDTNLNNHHNKFIF